MKITIIGTGYVGLVSGACFAELGHDVFCIDKNEDKIQMLLNGQIPFYEPGLMELVHSNFLEGRLSFSTDIKEGVKHGLVIFVAVDTPSKPSGEADLSSVENVARQIGSCLSDYRLIVEKSTVPVQTGEWLMDTIKKAAPDGVDFDIASNPEFLREGTAVDDFLKPDRVVIGVTGDRASSLLVKLYEPLNAPLLITDINSAELIKHSANAYLAMKISFINSIANICDLAGADISKVARGIGLDKRIGMDFLKAGIGYGGSCFPKDVSAFINIAETKGFDFKILKAVQDVNIAQHELVVKKLESYYCEETLENKRIALLGLSFKPNTDDLRNAPSLIIIRQLLSKGAQIRVYDPVAMDNAKKILSDTSVVFCNNPYEALEEADALALLTEWKEFNRLDFIKIRSIMRDRVVIDGRNMYDPARMQSMGFLYFGIGRR